MTQKAERRPLKWEGGTGVVSLPTHRLSGDATAHLKTIVEGYCKDQGIKKVPPLKPFFEVVESAMAKVRAQQQLAKESSPAVVRKNLKLAGKAANLLIHRLNALDGNSCMLLREAAKGDVDVNLARLQVGHISRGLNGALLLAKEYPQSGNLRKKYLLDLAIDVKIAIENNLGVSPKTTRGGLFDDVLGVLVDEAKGKRDSDVHGLVEDALATR